MEQTNEKLKRGVGRLLLVGIVIFVAVALTQIGFRQSAASSGPVVHTVGVPAEGAISPIKTGAAPNTLQESTPEFCNSTSIEIPIFGNATPFPSTITVSGGPTSITGVSVTLKGFTHIFPGDLEILLVSPAGKVLILDNGAGGSEGSTAVVNQTITFSSSATMYLPKDDFVVTGTYKPTSYRGTPFCNPIAADCSQFDVGGGVPTLSPGAPYAQTFNVFKGSNANGVWKLYVRDVSQFGLGFIDEGWCISFPTEPAGCSNQLLTGSLGPGDALQPGTRLFRNQVAGLCGTPKAFPLPIISSTFSRFYDAYTITNNSGASACVTASLTTGCTTQETEIILMAYQGSFNPNDLSVNYLNDDGGIFPPNVTEVVREGRTMSFELANCASVVLVVSEIRGGPTGGDGCASYGLLVEGNICRSGCILNCPENVTKPNDQGQCGAVVTYATPACIGSCDPITCSPASGSFFPKGTTTVSCTNSIDASCMFTVTVVDSEAPALTCPSSIVGTTDTGQCCSVETFTVTATDNCPGVPTVSCSPASGTCFPKGTTTVTCTASDASTDSPDSTCKFTVTVKDTQAPTVTCPANIVGATDAGQCCSVETFKVTASDNCPGTPTVTCSPASGTCFPTGTTTVTCTASDASLDSPDSSCTFTVTVNDGQAPGISCPANITRPTDPGKCCAVATFNATATDNCPGVTVSCSPTSGTCFPKGTTTVTCTASDTSPASPDTACTFTVTVNDTQLPTITCPANVTAVAAAQCPVATGTVVTFAVPGFSDNCPGATVACSPASGAIFPVGLTTVTCTATDAAGNRASCAFTVTVFNGCLQDDSKPENVVVFNTFTGDYIFCCNGTVAATGRGAVGSQGCIFTIQHNSFDRRVLIKVDFAVKKGDASLQKPPGAIKCTILDRNVTNNVCNCSMGPPT